MLPGDVEYLWYPSVFWFVAGEDGQERCVDICQVVETTLEDVRFLDQRYCSRSTVGNLRYVEAGEDMDSIANRPTLPMQFFYGPDHETVWWRDRELHEALSYVRRDWGADADVIIFPGLERWVEAAVSLREQLVPACSLREP